MVVTTGTTKGQSQKYLSGHVRNVIEDFLAALIEIAGVVLIGKVPIEGSGNNGFGVIRIQFVAGNLLTDELIVGFVIVETI